MNTAVKMGIPPKRRTRARRPTSGDLARARRRSARSTWPTPTRTIANGGKAQTCTSSTRWPTHDGKMEYRAKPHDHAGRSTPTSRDVSYAIQQVVQARHRHQRAGARTPGGRQDRHRDQRPGHVSSSWFVGYTPQLSTAVMYVRGDGNDAARTATAYNVGYFGAGYPTATWTEVMRETSTARRSRVPAAGEPPRQADRPRAGPDVHALATPSPSRTAAPTPRRRRPPARRPRARAPAPTTSAPATSSPTRPPAPARNGPPTVDDPAQTPTAAVRSRQRAGRRQPDSSRRWRRERVVRPTRDDPLVAAG